MEVKEEMSMIPKYEPKPVFEEFDIGEYSIELDRRGHTLRIAGDNEEITLPYRSVPDLVQFLAWAMRTRMEVTADGENTEVQKQGGESERGEV